MVQTCEDIVHVDTISPLPSSTEALPSRRVKSKEDISASRSTDRVTEVFASTRAYPSWWAEVEENKVLRRRRSIDDAILERNVCFVDTPGLSHANSVVGTIEPAQRYIEEQLAKTLSYAGMTESELVSMLGGNGGSQVDLVLYLLAQGMLLERKCCRSDTNLPIRRERYRSRSTAAPVQLYERHPTSLKSRPPFRRRIKGNKDRDIRSTSRIRDQAFHLQPRRQHSIDLHSLLRAL